MLDRFSRVMRGTRAYKAAFDQETQHGRDALADLLKFCGHGRPLYRKEQRETDRMLGRHEVALRVLSALNITEQELHDLYQSTLGE